MFIKKKSIICFLYKFIVQACSNDMSSAKQYYTRSSRAEQVTANMASEIDHSVMSSLA